MSTAKDTVYAYFRKKTKERFEDDDNLFNKGLLDSMEVLELVHFLEEGLGIELDPDDISEENFKSVNAICAMAEGKRR